MSTRTSEEYWVIQDVAKGLNQVISELAHTGKMDEALQMIEAKKIVLGMLENGITLDEVLDLIDNLKILK